MCIIQVIDIEPRVHVIVLKNWSWINLSTCIYMYMYMYVSTHNYMCV